MPSKPARRAVKPLIAPTPRMPEPLPLHHHRLANGVQVLICDLPHLHRVSLAISFSVGSRDEHDANAGASHMLEHLMFRGTSKHRGLREVGQAFEEIGGNFNGFTTRESTTYETLLPPESLHAGLALLAHVILSPRLTGIAAEREIIREEILSDYAHDLQLINVDDLILEALYGLEGLGRVIAGTPQEVERLTRAVIKEHYQTYYRGPGTILAVVGPIGPIQPMLRWIDEHFSPLGGGPMVPRDSSTPTPSPAPFVYHQPHDGTGQSDLVFGVETVVPSAPEFAALETAIRLLDDGLSSRLPRRLVDELGLVYDVEGYAVAARDRSVCQVRASCRHRRVARVTGEILAVLTELASTTPPEDELRRTHNRILWEHQALLDRPASLAQWLIGSAHAGHIADPRARCERLLEVKAEDVRQAAAAAFFGGGQRLAIVGDQGDMALESVRAVMEEHLGHEVTVQSATRPEVSG